MITENVTVYGVCRKITEVEAPADINIYTIIVQYIMKSYIKIKITDKGTAHTGQQNLHISNRF